MLRTFLIIVCLVPTGIAQALYESTQINGSDGEWEKEVTFEYNDTLYDFEFIAANSSCIYYSYNTTPQVCDIRNTVIEKLALNHPWVH